MNIKSIFDIDTNTSRLFVVFSNTATTISYYCTTCPPTDQTIQQKQHLSALSAWSYVPLKTMMSAVCALVLLDLSATFDTVDCQHLYLMSGVIVLGFTGQSTTDSHLTFLIGLRLFLSTPNSHFQRA